MLLEISAFLPIAIIDKTSTVAVFRAHPYPTAAMMLVNAGNQLLLSRASSIGKVDISSPDERLISMPYFFAVCW